MIHPVDLGFVNVWGQEFAGCLPDVSGSDEEANAALQPYIAALDAALAQKAAQRQRHGR